MYGMANYGHPFGCCCASCAAGQVCAGTRPLAGIASASFHMAHGYHGFGAHYNAIDPTIVTAAIQGGTSIATSSISAAQAAAEKEKSEKHHKKHKYKAAAAPPVAPVDEDEGVPGWVIGLGVLVAVVGVGYAVTHRKSGGKE